MRYISSLAAVLLVLAACSRSDSSTLDTSASATSGTADRTTTAAMVANAIKANPAGADSILKANGYTADSYQREMYAIAADSQRSAAYADARKK